MTEIDSVTAGGASQAGDCGVGQHGDAGLIVCIGRHRHSRALAEVYRRHGGPMHDLAARVCGFDRSGEVVQAVLIDLWHRPARFDPDRSSLRAYLLGNAHALAVEIVRAGSSRRPRSSLRPRSGPRPDTSLAALASRVGDHAWPVLSRLPEDQRTAIGLAYFCGYRSADVAELVGKPQGAVHRQIRAGLVGLGSQLSSVAPGSQQCTVLGTRGSR